MALASWKSFRFFDSATITPAEDSPKLGQSSLSAISSNGTNVFIGAPTGDLTVLNQSFRPVRSFKAHDAGSLTHIVAFKDSPNVVTLAETLSEDPELKVWAFDKPEKKTGIPKCLCRVTIQNGRRQFPVSAFAVLSDLSQVAVGFANGSVTIIRGDFIHDRGTKQRTVVDGNEPITGLEFRQGNTTALFIATTGKISTLVISGKGQGQAARTLDDHGCAVGTMIEHARSREIMVARDDAIYTYNLRGRGPSFAYEGPKKLISTLGDYVVFASPPSSVSISATSRTLGASTDDRYGTTALTILDPDLKIIAHNETLPAQVAHLFTAWDMLFLITQDGKIIRYREKSSFQKLELLYQRDYYVLAINLAQKQKAGIAQQNVIFRKYGDYLYSKGDYDTAMQQYLRAIDNTEPSEIIRKFLDNQRIKNLIEYLEELHEHGKASADHTTLLLNCYAKLKDVQKLEAFIRQPGELKFDLETAIAMCRQGGYSDQAAFLARKHNEHSLVVDILIEDLKRYPEAMAYIVRLEPPLAYENAMRYATILLEHVTVDETKFFVEYFTGVFRSRKDVLVEQEMPISQPGYASRATTAVQNLASLIPLPYLGIDSNRTTTNAQGEDVVISQQVVESAGTEADFVSYNVPRPREAFPVFVGHDDEFIEFLEACLGSSGIANDEKGELYDTLFEMYLALANRATGHEAERWTGKATAMIAEKTDSLSSANALLLSRLASFKEGSVLIKEQEGLYFDIFRSFTSARDTQGAIKALRKYGPEEPRLYPAALAYLTSSKAILEEAGAEVETVLHKIDSDRLMAPLQVIQILSQSDVANMGLVKNYLVKTVDKERADTSANTRLLASYRSDTDTKVKDVEEILTKPVAFTATRCSSCGTPLDLPIVHFLCKHSYHQRCLSALPGEGNDDEIECPICASQNATIKAIKQAQSNSASRSDLFFDALNRSRDKFGTVSEWFGRGVMDLGTLA